MKVVATNFSLALHILFCKIVCCFFVNSFSSVNNFRSWLEEEEGERGVVEKKKLKREKAKAGLRKKKRRIEAISNFSYCNFFFYNKSAAEMNQEYKQTLLTRCWISVSGKQCCQKWSLGRQSWQH